MTQPTLAAPPDDEVTIGCPGHLSTPRDWCLFCKLATAKKQRDYARDEAVMFAERVLDTRLQRDEARAALADAYRQGAEAMREAAAKACDVNSDYWNHPCGCAGVVAALPLEPPK